MCIVLPQLEPGGDCYPFKTISTKLSEGQCVDTLPNFDADALEQIAFLIGNKTNEDFVFRN